MVSGLHSLNTLLIQTMLPSTSLVRQPKRWNFSVTYPVADGAGTVEESYALDQSGLTYRYRMPHASSRLRVPLLVSDGEHASTISIDGQTVVVSSAGSQAHYAFAEGAELSLNEQHFGNRNGIYQLLTVIGSDSLHLAVQ